MLRIAVCDDEAGARDELWLKLDKILDEENGEKVVYDFSFGKNAANWLEKHPGEIDLLFLDVEMRDMNGMETAKRIREFNQELMIVFVTGYADYVFDGYAVGAMDYLVKPADEEKLLTVIRRAREKIARENDKAFILKNAEGTYRFSYKDILYFYSEKRKVILVSKSGEFAFYDKLDRVQDRIKEGFVRIHQRYLVNAAAVTHIGRTMAEIGNNRLPISRAFRETAAKSLAEEMLRG